MLKTHRKARNYGLFEPKFSTIRGQKLLKTCGKLVENFFEKVFHIFHNSTFSTSFQQSSENVENLLKTCGKLFEIDFLKTEFSTVLCGKLVENVNNFSGQN